jgi:magnesium transporter
MRPEAVKELIQDLDSDDAADIAQAMEDISDDEGPDAEDLLTDRQHKHLLEFDPDTAGGLMQVEVFRALPVAKVSEIMEALRNDTEEEIPNSFGTVFVVTPMRKLLGTVSLNRLLRAPLKTTLESIMRTDPLTVQPEAPLADVIRIFEKYDLHSLAVVNKRNQLLGRITIDDVLDSVMDENARQQARAVGVDEGGDLFAPPTQTMRQRLPWLVINLGTAILAAAVIALFESSIAKLTTLAVLMPIVASMGGNATTQTQTVIIRGLALGHITPQNAWALFKKEFLSGTYIGTVLALMMALGTWIIYHNPKLALVIAMATLANHIIAAFGGWVTPLVLKRFKYDPAIATTVITTTFTDVGGFFCFLGLATLFLM